MMAVHALAILPCPRTIAAPGVYWPDDQCFYFAVVVGMEQRTATNAPPGHPPTPHLHVHYEDGVREWVNPGVDRIQWIEYRGLEGLVPAEGAREAKEEAPPPPEPVQEAAPEPVPPPEAVPAPSTGDVRVNHHCMVAVLSFRCVCVCVLLLFLACARCRMRFLFVCVSCSYAINPLAQVPSQVAVVCGPLRGVFDVAGGFCILAGSNKRVTPTEFERLGGKGSSKKWKVQSQHHQCTHTHTTHTPPMPWVPAVLSFTLVLDGRAHT